MGSKIRKFKENVQNPEMELSAWKTVKIRKRLRIHKGIDVQQEERKTTCKGRQSDRRCRKSFTNSPAKRFLRKATSFTITNYFLKESQSSQEPRHHRHHCQNHNQRRKALRSSVLSWVWDSQQGLRGSAEAGAIETNGFVLNKAAKGKETCPPQEHLTHDSCRIIFQNEWSRWASILCIPSRNLTNAAEEAVRNWH